jgi:hypothetical protein
MLRCHVVLRSGALRRQALNPGDPDHERRNLVTLLYGVDPPDDSFDRVHRCCQPAPAVLTSALPGS